jgi:hypothetical protein
MLRPPHQLIDDHRSQDQQLRALQARHGKLRPPFKDVLEQPVNGLNGLRAPFVARLPDFDAPVTMGIGASPRGDQFAATLVAPWPQGGGVLVGGAQDLPHRPRPLLRQPGGRRLVSPVGDRQRRRQRQPPGAHRHGPLPFPALPPAGPAAWAPPGLGSHRAGGNDPLLPLGGVPPAPAGRQRGALPGDRAAVRGPGPPPGDHGPSDRPPQPGPAWRQGGQAALPRAAARNAPLLRHQAASLAWPGLVWSQQRQEGVGRREAAAPQDDDRRHEAPIGRRGGPAARSRGGRRWPGQPRAPENEADT